MKNILFVLTSNEKLGDTGKKTGFWIEEFAAPYYALTDHDVAVTIASPKGGKPPVDPKSNTPEASTQATERFKNDIASREKLNHTLPLAYVDADEYDAVFFAGGHGPLWDLAEDKDAIRLVESFYRDHKPVAAVCHGPAVFRHTKNEQGEPLIKGKQVTGFTNSEEAAVQLTDVVPFSVENALKENGGIYSNADDWKPYVIMDDNLITGQNPASSELVAEKLLAKLS